MANPPVNWQSAIGAGNYNQINQGAKSTWSGGSGGVPLTNTTRLNPTLEKAQTQQDNTFGSAVKKATPVLSNPTLNFSKIPKMTVNPGLTGQNAIMSRLGPQIQRENAALHTQLVNWGLQPGTEAYDQAMARQGEQSNDLLTRAAIGGIGLDTEAHRQGISDQQAAINTPLNALNTLGGMTSSNMAMGTGQGRNDTMAALQAMNDSNIAARNNKQQSTSDYLNLGVNAIGAAPEFVDWLKSFWGP